MTAGPVEIALAVASLARGELVAFPTETVYGLGADATSQDAVAKVFAAKGRPAHNPLIVHISGIPMARASSTHWPDIADRLAQAFWPGPLTLVLPKSGSIPDLVTAGGPNVALRCPLHPLTLALIETFGRPIVGPSANPSGRVSPTTAQHVSESFGDSIIILDGGPCQGGIESTVVSLVGPPRILRPGLIGPEALSSAAGHEILPAANLVHNSDTPAASPGLLSQHYAPITTAFLMGPDHRGMLDSLLTSTPAAKAAALLIAQHDLPDPHTTIRMPGKAQAYAAGLYAALRQADSLRCRAILIESVPEDGNPIWTAVTDRLRRATVPFSPHTLLNSLGL